MVEHKASHCEERIRSSFAVCSPFGSCDMKLSWKLAVSLDLLIPCEQMRLEIDHTKPCILLLEAECFRRFQYQ